MKPHEIRQLSESELESRVEELTEEIYNLRFQKATRQDSNTKRISTLRREIAQIHTILREHQLGIRSLVVDVDAQASEADEAGEQA